MEYWLEGCLHIGEIPFSFCSLSESLCVMSTDVLCCAFICTSCHHHTLVALFVCLFTLWNVFGLWIFFIAVVVKVQCFSLYTILLFPPPNSDKDMLYSLILYYFFSCVVILKIIQCKQLLNTINLSPLTLRLLKLTTLSSLKGFYYINH